MTDPAKSPPLPDPPQEEPLSTPEILGWVELSCWTMVALAPFLYWVNGPAVSTDQFLVRTILVTVAVAGGIGINVVRRRMKQ